MCVLKNVLGAHIIELLNLQGPRHLTHLVIPEMIVTMVNRENRSPTISIVVAELLHLKVKSNLKPIAA
jgi:hypothetical protein